MDEVKAELLVNKVANRIALIRVTTLRQKVTEVMAEAMVDTLTERLALLETEALRLDSY